MKRLFFLSLFAVLTFGVSAQEYRDVVYLKNGSVIKGFYKSFFMNDTLRMETLDGSLLVCPTSDILRIAKEKTDVYVVEEDESADLSRVWRPRGYCGSFELLFGWCGDDTTLSTEAVYTTHGYRFNPNLYAGLGIGLERYIGKSHELTAQQDRPTIPLYGEVSWYMLKSRITPYISCRGGYAIYGQRTWSFSPSVGVDFGITPHIGAFLKLSYRWQKYSYDWEFVGIEDDDITATYVNTTFISISTGIHF